MSNGLFLSMALITLCFVRLVSVFELPYAIIIPSTNILVGVVIFCRTELFVFGDVHVTVTTIAAAVWIAGSAVSFIRLGYVLLKYKKALNSMVSVPNANAERVMAEIAFKTRPRQKYRLICSESVGTPVVSGFLTPTICIPALPFPDSELENILSHEWNHFLHKDTWVKLLFHGVKAVLWWNPLLYMLCKDLDQMLEIHCDIKSTHNCDETERVKYLESVLSVIKLIKSSNKNPSRALPVSSVAFIGGNHSESIIKQRFDAVLEYKKKPSRIKNVMICGVMILAFFMSYTVIVQSAGEPPAEDGVTYPESAFTAERAYIVVNSDDTYTLYIDDVCLGRIGAEYLLIEPFSLLPHINESK
jgi:beta-lactamase regulating signal transducer with metallopeptidase domain